MSEATLILLVFINAGVWSAACAIVGASKGRAEAGAIAGLLLGPIGVLIIVAMESYREPVYQPSSSWASRPSASASPSTLDADPEAARLKAMSGPAPAPAYHPITGPPPAPLAVASSADDQAAAVRAGYLAMQQRRREEREG